MVWTGSLLVGVGDNATIFTSPDGHVWTEQSSAMTDNLYTVGYSGSQFVALGYGTEALSSGDAVTWDVNTLDRSTWINSVVWSGSKWVAVGTNGALRASDDGIDWSYQQWKSYDMLKSVIWNGTHFIAAGFSDSLLLSTDGESWATVNPGMIINIMSIVQTEDSLLVGAGYLDRNASLVTSLFDPSTPIVTDRKKHSQYAGNIKANSITGSMRLVDLQEYEVYSVSGKRVSLPVLYGSSGYPRAGLAKGVWIIRKKNNAKEAGGRIIFVR
jgi:hypothetical protein